RRLVLPADSTDDENSRVSWPRHCHRPRAPSESFMSSRTEEALATRRRAKSAAEAQAPDVLFFPETSRRELLVTLAVFLVSCAYLRLFRDVMVTDPDEGVALQGAERILRGQVLYRDFFSFMTPGSFYWMAVLFNVFGSSVGVARSLLVFYVG